MVWRHVLLLNLIFALLISLLIDYLKLFKTSNMEVVKYCQSAFNFVIPSVQIAQKSEKFVKKFNVVHKCGI